MAISQQRVIRSTSCTVRVLGGVFGNGESNGTISGWIILKSLRAISLQRIIQFILCRLKYTDHTLLSDTTMTIDARI